MGLFMRLLFCWVTFAVHLANAFYNPNLWGGFPMPKPQNPPAPYAPFFPYAPVRPSAQPPIHRPHFIPPFHNPFYQYYQSFYPTADYQPFYYTTKPPARPTQRPWWVDNNVNFPQRGWPQFPSWAQRNPYWPYKFPFGQQQPGYYTEKPNVMPGGFLPPRYQTHGTPKPLHVKGPAVLQKLQHPSLQFSRQSGRWFPRFQ